MKGPTRSQTITSLLPRLATWLLPLFVLVLLLHTLAAIWPSYISGCASILLAVSGVCIFVYKSRLSEQPITEWVFKKEMLLSIFSISAANWLTFVLNHSLRMGPVIASAVIGLAGGILLPKYGSAIYCGSFVGMSSKTILPDVPALLLASLIAGIVFQMNANSLNGIGGKLGTIAFIGSVITGVVFQLPFSSSPMPTVNIAWSIIIISVAAALLTWAVGNQQKIGVVIGSSLVGLVGGLLLPLLFPAYGELLLWQCFAPRSRACHPRINFPHR